MWREGGTGSVARGASQPSCTVQLSIYLSLFPPPLLTNVSIFLLFFCHYDTGELICRRDSTTYTPLQSIILEPHPLQFCSADPEKNSQLNPNQNANSLLISALLKLDFSSTFFNLIPSSPSLGCNIRLPADYLSYQIRINHGLRPGFRSGPPCNKNKIKSNIS